jgi:hypothetical protein
MCLRRAPEKYVTGAMARWTGLLYTVGRTPWTGDEPVTNRINAHKTSMPRMGLESTIPVFGLAKTVHALDRAATVIGLMKNYSPY